MIYLDSAATTPVDPDVFRAMKPFFMEQYGNPSSPHSMGRKARKAVEKSRCQCAETLKCEPEQLFFTSGSTESNNWALRIIEKYVESRDRGYVLIDPLSHKSILAGSYSFHSFFLPVDTTGIIDWEQAMDRVWAEDRVAVALNWVNNETGIAQPLGHIDEYSYEHGFWLHVDATQAIGKLTLDLSKRKGISTLAISGHKFGAPKAVGLLYVRDPDKPWVQSLINGGKQERSLRAGTENVPGIVGLGAAMEKLGKRNCAEWIAEGGRIKEMRNFLRNEIAKIPGVRFNGGCEFQLPYYLNVSFKGILGEALVLALDRRGIYVSSGSACNTGSLTPSHVLKAIGVDSEYIDGTIRISLSENNTLNECEEAAKAIKEEVEKLRSVSPTWKGENS